MIFTTIDQTLSNFLCIPYALSNGQANINAGAIASSYLVFDEFHLFPPEALATTIAMLKLLNGVVPFLLMTATFSSSMLSELSEQLDAIVIPKQGQSAALQKLPSQQKERRFHSVDNLLTGQAVVGHHATQGRCRSIAICNTVDRAQALYAAVNDLKSPDTKVVLLHSRFYKEDRAEKETWLRREFGKDDKLHKEQSAILIATQVVEVGLDITCEVLHTEVAPANAILQRAGRCARYQSEQGDVYLYQVPLDVNGRPQYHPYHDKIQGALCESTWQAFIDRDGAVLSFIDEQTLISQVHGQADKETLQLLEERRNSHQDMMEMAMGFQDRGLASELIRSVDSRGVIVHPNPKEDTDEIETWRLRSPWRWQSFSLFKGSVFGAFKRLEALADEIGHEEWFMMRLSQVDQAYDPEEWSTNKPEYTWDEVYEQSQLEGALLVVVHPRLASYSTERGFQIGVINDESWTVRLRERSTNRGDKRFTYDQETYQEHIAGLLRAYQDRCWDKDEDVWRQPLQDEMRYVFAQLEQRLSLPNAMLDKISRYIIAGHDLGKLGEGWQNWTHTWQKLINQDVAPEWMLAHTDYDGSAKQDTLQRQLKKQIGPRPPHAAESAYGLIPLTAALVEKNHHLLKAINSAITRHHGAQHKGTVQPFQAHPQAYTALQEAFALVGLEDLSLDGLKWDFTDEASISKYLVEPNKPVKQMLIYFLLVRILRLADQRSQK